MNETFAEAYERVTQELCETGEGEYKEHTIRPAYDQVYTVTGYDRYWTVEAAMRAIDKDKI